MINRVIVQKGDLFGLGEHRLLCGDSENEQDMNRLVNNKLVHMVLTGPPYFNQRKYSHWDDYNSFLYSMENVIKNCVKISNNNSVYAWQLGRGSCDHKDHVAHISLMLEKYGLTFQDAIAWIKPGANYSIILDRWEKYTSKKDCLLERL